MRWYNIKCKLMVLIGETLVSLDLFEKKFKCDLSVCKGMCCVEGVAGAPLEVEETKILKKIYPLIYPYLKEKNISAIEEQGLYVTDSDGEWVTPLISGEECAYAIFEDGIAKCAIEKAYFEGLISFRKPISCHLYPIRIKKIDKLEALNYHEWDVCKPAFELGEKEGIPVYRFLKDVLIRKYGEKWYRELEETAEAYYEKQDI